MKNIVLELELGIRTCIYITSIMKKASNPLISLIQKIYNRKSCGMISLISDTL
jgi:hypothetical protein